MPTNMVSFGLSNGYHFGTRWLERIQTAKGIKDALSYHEDEDFILEHHSNLVLSGDDNEAQARRLLTDRWSQPIIITTMVQFLESVYSHKSGGLRKLHNMANAVIIFDEARSVPVKCVHLFNDALNYLHTFGSCTALLCTATQPLLDKVEKPIRFSSPSELIESAKARWITPPETMETSTT